MAVVRHLLILGDRFSCQIETHIIRFLFFLNVMATAGSDALHAGFLADLLAACTLERGSGSQGIQKSSEI
jgi:hypothetical protein